MRWAISQDITVNISAVFFFLSFDELGKNNSDEKRLIPQLHFQVITVQVKAGLRWGTGIRMPSPKKLATTVFSPFIMHRQGSHLPQTCNMYGGHCTKLREGCTDVR